MRSFRAVWHGLCERGGAIAVKALFLTQLDALVEALQAARFIELSHEALIVHS